MKTENFINIIGSTILIVTALSIVILFTFFNNGNLFINSINLR